MAMTEFITCMSEWLMHVAAWYHGTPDQSYQIWWPCVHWQTPNHAKFHRVPPNGVREKHCNFYTVHYLAPRGASWTKLHQSGWWCIARFPLPNFVPFWKPLYEISVAKLLRCRWRRGPHKHTTRRPASADRTARRQFQAGLRGDVGL